MRERDIPSTDPENKSKNKVRKSIAALVVSGLIAGGGFATKEAWDNSQEQKQEQQERRADQEQEQLLDASERFSRIVLDKLEADKSAIGYITSYNDGSLDGSIHQQEVRDSSVSVHMSSSSIRQGFVEVEFSADIFASDYTTNRRGESLSLDATVVYEVPRTVFDQAYSPGIVPAADITSIIDSRIDPSYLRLATHDYSPVEADAYGSPRSVHVDRDTATERFGVVGVFTSRGEGIGDLTRGLNNIVGELEDKSTSQ